MGPIPGFHLAVAGITIGALPAMLLAKITQQDLSSAPRCFTVAQHGFHLSVLDTLELLIPLGPFDHPAQQYDIGKAVEHPGIGCFAVTTGAARLLVVAFQCFGDIEMGNKTDIRFVDAHTEGYSRHHDKPIVAKELSLIRKAHRPIKTGVIGKRRDTLFGEEFGYLFNLFSRHTVDNPRFIGMVVLG